MNKLFGRIGCNCDRICLSQDCGHVCCPVTRDRQKILSDYPAYPYLIYDLNIISAVEPR